MRALHRAAMAVILPWLLVGAAYFHTSNLPVAGVLLGAAVFFILIFATEITNGNAR